MKKVIWIDIGTHFAQEYNSIFGSNFRFYRKIGQRLISGNIFGRGTSVSFQDLNKIFLSRKFIRKRAKEIFTIFIEANQKIIQTKKVYRDANIVFNIALTDDDQLPLSIAKLYLGSGGNLSQSGSLFSEKHRGHEDKFTPVIGVSADTFFRVLEKYLNEIFNDYVIILRLNCEGVEDNVIYSAHNIFGRRLVLICGALKDVADVKGIEALKRLEKFIKDNNISFAKFASPINTWVDGQKSIQNLLKELNFT